MAEWRADGRLRLALVGSGLFGWLISYPFYGSPVFTLLGTQQAGFFCHLFGGGLAAGFFLAGFLLPFRVVPHRLVRFAGLFAALVPLSCLTLPAFVFLAPAAGLVAAWPIFAWACNIARTATLIPLLAAGVVGANLLCWCCRMLAASKVTALPAVLILSLIWCCALLFLPPTPHQEKKPLAIARWAPLFLFALATYPTYGIHFRVLLPLATESGLGLRLGCLPYVIVFAAAAFLAVRYSLMSVAAAGLSFLGLASVSLAALSAFTPVPLLFLFALTAALIGLACTDFYYWTALVGLAAGGKAEVLGLGLGLCVVLITGTGVLVDTTNVVAVAQTPLAALLDSAFLFLLLPLLLPRLALGMRTDTAPANLPAPADPPERGEAPATRALLDVLTPAERRVFALLLTDKTYGEIAADLLISPNTVKYHVRNIYRKAGCSSRQELQARFRTPVAAPVHANADPHLP